MQIDKEQFEVQFKKIVSNDICEAANMQLKKVIANDGFNQQLQSVFESQKSICNIFTPI